MFSSPRQKYLVVAVVVLLVAGGAVMAKALFLNGGGAPESSSDIDLSRGLVGWWKLDGNAKDSTPYANNGTLVGTPTPGTDREGNTDGAMSFNGTNQYISLPASGLPTSALTVSLWVNQSTLVNYYDLAANNWTAEGSWNLYTLGNGQVLFGLYHSSTQYNSACSTGSMTTNSWHHLVGTYDGSTVKAYFDGSVCSTTKSVSGVTLHNTGNWTVGEHAAGSSTHSIDDVRVYNRALSANEISALYKSYDASLALGAGENGLVGWWKLDGNANDSSPYGDNGSLAGSASFTTDRHQAANRALLNTSAGDYAQILNVNSKLRFTDASSFSLSAWIKPSSVSGLQAIIGQQRSSYVAFELTSNKLRLCLDDACDTSTTSIIAGVWQHVAATYDGSSHTAILYINGQADTPTVTYDGNGMPAYANWYIGYESRFSDQFIGSIDDARIYNRVLSASDISSLYNSYDSSVSLYSSADSSGSSVNLSSGLLGEWDFNGNAKDATPYGNNGIVSGATLTSDRRGRAASAYQLGSTNQWISIGSPATYQNLPLAFTYSIWLESTGTSSTQWPEIMGASNTHTNFGIRTNNYGGNVYFEYGTSPYSGTTFAGLASYALGSNTWHMYTVTYDGSALKAYLDGAYKTQATGVALNPSFGGLNFTTGTSGFTGSVDDARVWSRALSQAEIVDLYSIYR